MYFQSVNAFFKGDYMWVNIACSFTITVREYHVRFCERLGMKFLGPLTSPSWRSCPTKPTGTMGGVASPGCFRIFGSVTRFAVWRHADPLTIAGQHCRHPIGGMII